MRRKEGERSRCARVKRARANILRKIGRELTVGAETCSRRLKNPKIFQDANCCPEIAKVDLPL